MNGIFQTFFVQVSLNSKKVTKLQKNVRSVGREFFPAVFCVVPFTLGFGLSQALL